MRLTWTTLAAWLKEPPEAWVLKSLTDALLPGIWPSRPHPAGATESFGGWSAISESAHYVLVLGTAIQR